MSNPAEINFKNGQLSAVTVMQNSNIRINIQDEMQKTKNDQVSLKSKSPELGWLAQMGSSVYGPSQCNDKPETYQLKSHVPI